jgi:hypothetical protein
MYYEHSSTDYWTRTNEEYGKALQPLIAGLERYDECRIRLEQHGGGPADLAEFRDALQAQITLDTYHGSGSGSLARAQELVRLIGGLSYDLRLEVRSHAISKLPVFYLARTRSDYHTNYDLVVEDYYVSGGYPLPDERYAALTRAGRNLLHLRMSPFRGALLNSTDGCKLADKRGTQARSSEIDAALYAVGHHVLSAAWHEDQHPAFALSGWLAVDELREAIEVLYLVLTTDLCDLRGSMHDLPAGFFRDVYPQPAIDGLLRTLVGLSGDALSELPKLALRRYAQLCKTLTKILRHDVSHRSSKVPIVKLLLANYGRFDSVRASLAGDERLAELRETLRAQAKNVAEEFGQEPA